MVQKEQIITEFSDLKKRALVDVFFSEVLFIRVGTYLIQEKKIWSSVSLNAFNQ